MFFRLWATPVPPVESSPTLGHAVLLFGLDPLDGPKDGAKKKPDETNISEGLTHQSE